MKDHKNSVIPHASRIFNTGHQFWPNRSSVIYHTRVIKLAMKPHLRNTYKLTYIIQTESPN